MEILVNKDPDGIEFKDSRNCLSKTPTEAKVGAL